MHLAAAFNVPLVAVFGSTDNTTTYPLSDTARVVREPVDCAPCMKRECPTDHICMKAVKAEKVIATALDVQNTVTAEKSRSCSFR